MKIAFLVLISMLTVTAFGQTASSDNAQLTKLFTIDQSARQGKNIDWAKLNLQDAERRKEVHRMLENGEVRTANDYFHAALVYQHGQTSNDYLLAHVLAVNSISFGGKNARWLASATLDRYLRSLSKPQIYGTQFMSDPKNAWMQQTMDTSLITDSMRANQCVISIEEQKKLLQKIDHGGSFTGTFAESCK